MIYRKPGVFMGGEKVNTETIEFECVSLSLLAGSFFLDMFFFGTRVPAHSRRLRVHLLLSAWAQVEGGGPTDRASSCRDITCWWTAMTHHTSFDSLELSVVGKCILGARCLTPPYVWACHQEGGGLGARVALARYDRSLAQ
jgi:hypothetical protein